MEIRLTIGKKVYETWAPSKENKWRAKGKEKRSYPFLGSLDQLTCMWMPIAMIKMVTMQKYITAWTRMAIPLVHMLPNSITLVLDGSWNSNPGDKRMNKTTATMTGPQSALISLFRSLPLSFFNSLLKPRFWMFENFSSSTNWKVKRCTFYYVGEMELIFLVAKLGGDAKLSEKDENWV